MQSPVEPKQSKVFERQMRYFVYKTTCLPTGKYYIGVHSERRQSDGYIGCGICSDGTAVNLKNKKIKSAFIDSVIKYGYKNFKRDIIKEFSSVDEAYDFEKQLVTKDVVNDSRCLNIRLGGTGGLSDNVCKKIEILDCKTGEIISFDSQAACAHFLGLQNISGKKRFRGDLYIVKGNEIPITLKRPNEDPIYFYDIMQAVKHSGCESDKLKMLLSGERKSCKGWFLGDFDFNSSFYKHAKEIRKTL
jgi:hypothetical protein